MVLDVLTGISVLLLIGVIITYYSGRAGISDVLSLFAMGYLLQYIKIGDERIFLFSKELTLAIAVIALIMIVFDSSSRFTFRIVEKETILSFNFTVLSIILNLIIITIVAKLLFEITWIGAFVFSGAIVGTDTASSLSILGGFKHKVIDFLKIESVINTPFTLILPILALELTEGFTISSLVQQIGPILQQIITGIGAGIVIGFLVVKLMRGQYMQILSPLALISSTLLTYLLAEDLNGSGVLAVATMGIVFGNLYVKRKETLKTFGSVFSKLFEILLFLLLGLVAVLPVKSYFYLAILLLFMIHLSLRYIAVHFGPLNKLSRKEKMFISLSSAKGVALAVVAFNITIPSGKSIVDMLVLFMIYSIITSVFITKFSKYFLGVEQKKEA